MHSQAYKRYITTLLLLVYIFNHLDRAIFSFLMEPIKQEFGLSDTQLGFLLGPALVIFYATLGVPIARWADRSNRVNIMSGAVLLWSVIVMLTAAVGRFWQVALARVGVGIGEAGFSAIAISVIGDYHTNHERARALSTFMLALPVAHVLSSLMAGWINEIYGWRAVFLAAGLPGIVLALLMKLTVKEPARRPSGVDVNVTEERPALRTVFTTLWQHPTLRHLIVGQALANIVLQGMGWSPTFFLRNHAMSTGELGTWLAVINGAGGVAGIWLSGYLTSRYGAQDQSAKLWLMAGAAALVLPLATIVLWCPVKELALVMLLVAQVPMLFFLSPTSALVQDLTGPGMRATMMSVFILVQVLLGGVIGGQLVGLLSDALLPIAGNNAAALRLSMNLTCLIGMWAAIHFILAGRSLRRHQRVSLGEAPAMQNSATLRP